LHIGLLGPQDAVVDGARQWQRLGLLAAAVAGAVDLACGRQPDDCPAAEVGDQEVHLAGAEHLREPGRDRRDRVDRRRRLYLVEELADVDPTGPGSAHGAEPSGAEPSGRQMRRAGTLTPRGVTARARFARTDGGHAARSAHASTKRWRRTLRRLSAPPAHDRGEGACMGRAVIGSGDQAAWSPG